MVVVGGALEEVEGTTLGGGALEEVAGTTLVGGALEEVEETALVAGVAGGVGVVRGELEGPDAEGGVQLPSQVQVSSLTP